MSANKKREQLKWKCWGRCAYCGQELGQKWHADHLKPVRRISVYVRGRGYLATGQMASPENDHEQNLMPACIPCNADKADLELESWRKRLEKAHEVLLRNYSTYKHAHRFNMVGQIKTRVVFFFERPRIPLVEQ